MNPIKTGFYLERMAEYRSNHFVPKSYLKRWSHPIPWKSKNQKLWMKSLEKGEIIEVPLEKQCQKNNLYKLPENFSMEDKRTLEKHWFGFSDDLYSKAMDNSLDRGKMPENKSDIGNIVMQVIWQCYRTPRFKVETEKKILEVKSKHPELDDSKLDFTYQIPYLIVKTFPLYKKSANLEFVCSPNGKWFITSDNPATIWKNTWNLKRHVPTIFGEKFEDSSLEILCPLNPQCCLILRLNQRNENRNLHFIERGCRPDEVDRINQSIRSTADKVLYSFDKATLEKM